MLLDLLRHPGQPPQQRVIQQKYQYYIRHHTAGSWEASLVVSLIPKEFPALKPAVRRLTLASLSKPSPTVPFHTHRAPLKPGDSVLPKHSLYSLTPLSCIVPFAWVGRPFSLPFYL